MFALLFQLGARLRLGMGSLGECVSLWLQVLEWSQKRTRTGPKGWVEVRKARPRVAKAKPSFETRVHIRKGPAVVSQWPSLWEGEQ